MNDRNKKYNIGLDIGTGSVGWAVTDNNYNLLHAKKKNLWGIRLFDGAETAASRRTFRSTRRRYRRRRNRINWLNEIFSEELYKIDPSFLNRLNNSWVSKKDSSRQRDAFNLFIDTNYTDINYFHEYPTIFHLRKRLIEDTSKADIRLIYLAIHNILKYRGNFTYEFRKFDISNMNTGLTKALKDFNSQLDDFGISFPKDANYEKISQILLEKTNPTQKIEQIVADIHLEKDELQVAKEIFRMILGNKANLEKIFSLEDDEKTTVEFSSKDIDDILSNLESVLSREQFNLIIAANAIYSTITLSDILNNETYLSFAKVEQYCQHKKDLKKLKTMWSETTNEDAVKNNKKAYDKYINLGKYDIQEFYKDMDKFLKIATPKELAQDAKQKIADKTYLLKQRNNENGVIPFQLNRNELEAILDNQAQYYPFLKENRDKILSILSFRIPYYVGPLETAESSNPFAWMVKKSNQAVRPWNFDDVVDRERSSNNFIRRMTSTDSYLIGEPVLPKMSLLYQKYEVLNELNNLRISDGTDDSEAEKLDIDLKQRIYNELFKEHRKMTRKILAKWLIKNSYYKNPSIIGLTDKEKFNSSLSTYLDFKKIFGEEFVNDKNNQAQLEELVEWLTIFEDKKILKLKLTNSSSNYSENEIKRISNMRYQGWGRLSKKLLCDLKVETKTKNQHQSALYSILDLMWDTNRNFISVLKADKYNFEDKIQNYNLDKNQNLTPRDMVDNLQTSPALKRGIWQSIILVQEIVKFMHHAPEHIFLEFTRETDVSELTKSRYKRLTKLYKQISKNAKKLDSNLKDSLVPDKNIKKFLKDNKDNLSNDRLMLYFLQMGKSLYSDKDSLAIDGLSNYQIDHILPQSYIKDDSLENRALVLASENQHKADNLLLTKEVIAKNINRWRAMKDIGLMGPKKFKNLTRVQVTENDQEHFINRQLVQTSQIIKNVSNILDSMYGDQGTSCLETRANMATNFRKAFSHENTHYHFEHPEFVKNRNVNDYHHAQDAYLSCLLGLYMMKKYPTDNMLLVKKEYRKFFNSSKKEFDKKHHIPDFVKNGFIIGSLFKGDEQIDSSTGEILWNQDIKNMVSRIFQYKQFNVTKRTEVATGEFYNMTIYPHKDGKLVPLKAGLNPKIYGGYSGDKCAYMVLVRIDDKKNKLIKVPIRLAQQIKEHSLSLENYVGKNIKYKKSVRILKTNIPIGQLIYSPKIGYLSLKSDAEISNAQQLILPYEYIALLTLLQKNSESKYDEILANYDDSVLDDILREITKKMTNFYPFYSGELKVLLDNTDSFAESTIVQKVNTLQQLMIFLHANSSNANLEFKNVKKNRFGRKSHGVNITDTNLIYQSSTGLFESRIHID